MDAENDQMEALKSLDELTMKIFGLPIYQLHQSSHQPLAIQNGISQLPSRPLELERVVNELVKCRRIIGQPLTLDKMLNPIQEKQDGDSHLQFEGSDEAIISQVKYETAVEKGEIIEVGSKESGDEEEECQAGLSHQEIAEMCQKLENLCLQYGSPDDSLDIAHQICHLHIHVRQEMVKNARQTMLDQWFVMGVSR